ncbi:MAG: site-2 protease family protein, partial [Verrucomicrobiota bacterium]
MQLLISAFQFIFTFGLVILVFNLIIVVHELGHFLAARWRGLRVDKFQIWFGKPIWKKTINGVQYGLGTIPAGGFVALPQMAPMELVEGKRDENTGEPLTPISPLDKIIVAFAGPLFSFLLAVVLSVFVWMIGYPASKASNSTTIGVVLHDSGADKAGLKPGDEILEVAGKPVNTFGGMVDSVKWAIISSRTDDIEFVYQRDGKVET